MERIALQLSNVCINVSCARCGCHWETGDLEPHLVSDQEVLGVVCAQCCEAVDPTLARLVAVWHSAQRLIPPDFEGNPPDFWDELLRRLGDAVGGKLAHGNDRAQPKWFTFGAADGDVAMDEHAQLMFRAVDALHRSHSGANGVGRMLSEISQALGEQKFDLAALLFRDLPKVTAEFDAKARSIADDVSRPVPLVERAHW